jgi:biopolymer transport protein ExbB/TolQ
VIQTQQESYPPGPYDTATLLMLMLAACLPVIAAAIRLLRTAHEFGRNTLRFRATSDELNQLLDRLEKVADPEAKLEILHKTERALQAERREWLRLMIEAEWFG